MAAKGCKDDGAMMSQTRDVGVHIMVENQLCDFVVSKLSCNLQCRHDDE